MREKIAAGNWKMFKTFQEAEVLLAKLMEKDIPEGVSCIVAPPYPYLMSFVAKSSNSQIQISAQNCHESAEGAFTGEVAAPMLKSIGIPLVIIGHSERRQQHLESNETLKKKVLIALANGIRPVFCCGEPLEIRKNGDHSAFVTNQITESLEGLSPEQMEKIIIAYEPIWAIGTGETASPEQAQDMHEAIRAHLASMFSEKIAAKIPILYGGSVNPGNAKELFSKPDVDGGLVGGAALDAESFYRIIQSF